MFVIESKSLQSFPVSLRVLKTLQFAKMAGAQNYTKVHKQHSWSTMGELSRPCGLAATAHTTHSVLSNYFVQPIEYQLTHRTGIWRWCDKTKITMGGRKKDKWRKPTQENEWRRSPGKKSLNSQQHVLLILLEDSADVLEDVWVEEVYAAVYDVAHKCAGLFHIMHHLCEQNSL